MVETGEGGFGGRQSRTGDHDFSDHCVLWEGCGVGKTAQRFGGKGRARGRYCFIVRLLYVTCFLFVAYILFIVDIIFCCRCYFCFMFLWNFGIDGFCKILEQMFLWNFGIDDFRNFGIDGFCRILKWIFCIILETVFIEF